MTTVPEGNKVRKKRFIWVHGFKSFTYVIKACWSYSAYVSGNVHIMEK